MRPIKLAFRYDGTSVSAGKVRLLINACIVEDVEFEVPVEYGYLLLRPDTSEAAWRFLKELNEAQLLKFAKTALLREAVDHGFARAWRRLEEFKAEAPNGKPRFYSSPRYMLSGQCEPEWKADEDYVTITDGSSAFKFTLSRGFKVDLPLNVYCNPEGSRRYSLTPQTFKLAAEHISEFFPFIKELCEAEYYITRPRGELCFKKFFEDREEAYKLLREIRRDVARRRRRDEIFDTLRAKDILEFKAGFLVHNPFSWRRSVFYVTRNGEVYVLDYEKVTRLKEVVKRCVEKGRVPERLKPVDDDRTLREIARLVGKIKPELALVISP